MSGSVEGDLDAGGGLASKKMRIEVRRSNENVSFFEDAGGEDAKPVTTAGAALLVGDEGVNVGASVMRGDGSGPPVRVVEWPMRSKVRPK